jgi:hypothetical protein
MKEPTAEPPRLVAVTASLIGFGSFGLLLARRTVRHVDLDRKPGN